MEIILLTIALNLTSNGIYALIGRLIPKSYQFQSRIAFERSLKRWSRNKGIRKTQHHFVKRRFANYLSFLKKPITGVKPDPEMESFLKIFGEESVKFNTLNNYIQQQISIHQNELLSSIKEDVKKLLPDEARAEKKSYNAPRYYIPRTVIGDDKTGLLIDIVKEDLFVMLKAPAGAGKSTEIENLAHKLSIEECNVRIIRLIEYATDFNDLVDSYFKNWKNIPSNEEIFLLLDGLDEASEETTLQSQIKQFSLSNKNVHILISYRNSYSFFLSEISQQKEEKKDEDKFKIKELTLNSFTKKDIKQFIIERNGNSGLYDNLCSKDLLTLYSNPFYLNLYVELSKTNQYIVKSKSQLFEEILNERFRTEKRKGNFISRFIGSREFKTQQALSKLALTMQTAGVYDISNYDFQLIINNEKTEDCCKRIVLYQIGSYENWKFEHNNFQEFLAAKELLKLDYTKTSKLIFLEDGLLKRSWFNTIDFYLSLKEHSDQISENLLNQILVRHPESLVKLDKNNISISFRQEIFKQIYKNYKQKEIVFYTVVTAEELVAFVDLKTNSNLIEFLLQEINPQTEIHNLYNIIELIDKAEIDQTKYHDRIANKLLIFLNKSEYKDYSIHATILRLFEKFKWGSDEQISKLLENEILYAESTRSSLLQYIHTIKYKGLTSKRFLQFILKAKSEKTITMDFYVIVQLVNHLSEKEFIKFLLELSLDPSEISYYREDYSDLLKEIVKRSIKINSSNERILAAFKDMMTRAIKNFHWRQQELLKSFYIETNQLFKTFIEEFNRERAIPNSNRIKFIISGFLADEVCIDWCVNKFTQSAINADEIWNFHSSLRYNNNYKLAEIFLEKINVVTDDKFELPIHKNYQKIQEEAHLIFCKAVLEKNECKKLIPIIFKKRGKTIFDKASFFVIDRFGNELDALEQASDMLVSKFVHDWKENVTIERISNFIDKEWKGFQRHLHVQLKKDDNIPVENQEWIRNWCIENENLIDFENAITQGSEINEHRITNESLDYLSLIQKINYIPNQSICMKLISCIRTVNRSYIGNVKQYNLFDELRDVLTDEQIVSTITKNLSKNELPFILANSHIQIAEELEAEIVTPKMVKFILNPRVELWQRNNWLRIYFKLNGEVSTVISILEELELKTEKEWSIVESFIEYDKRTANAFLSNFLNDDKINRSKLAMSLIRVDNIEGLKEAYNIMYENENADILNEWRFSTPEKWLHEAQFNSSQIIPLLVKSIILQLTSGFKEYDSNPSVGILFNTLKNYLNGNEFSIWKSIEKEINEALEKSFKENGNTKNYQIITRAFQGLCEEMILKMDNTKSIENALLELEKILDK